VPHRHHVIPSGGTIFRQWAGADTPPPWRGEPIATYFDACSAHYDFRMQQQVYRVPMVIGELLTTLGVTSFKTLDVLDLGCGTGLLARVVSGYAKRLVGVDCSPGMLTKAHGRGHDELIEADMIAYLRSAAPASFDLIVGADSWCYLGPLDEILALAARALTPGGAICFTLDDPMALELPGGFARVLPTGRYVHRAEYVARVLKAAGLRPEITRGDLRLSATGRPISRPVLVEQGLSVKGLVIRATHANDPIAAARWGVIEGVIDPVAVD
jgi:predicted TPR repeat methyltransferase